MARGDHIKVSRGFYDHHGIDIGGGNVIHYSGENSVKTNAIICRVSKVEFAAGRPVLIVIHEGGCYSPEETVRRAEQHLGEGLGKYEFLGNNCEHFARWCKTGNKESKQVQRAGKAIIGGAIGRAAAFRLAGASLGPVGLFLTTVLGVFVGYSSDQDKTKPDDTPNIEDKSGDTPKIGDNREGE